jgi:hypothetical protein
MDPTIVCKSLPPGSVSSLICGFVATVVWSGVIYFLGHYRGTVKEAQTTGHINQCPYIAAAQINAEPKT